MMLTVPTWPKPGFREGVARLRGQGSAGAGADGNGRVVDGVEWSAVRMERGMLADAEEPERRG
jgi:hypothetical protein